MRKRVKVKESVIDVYWYHRFPGEFFTVIESPMTGWLEVVEGDYTDYKIREDHVEAVSVCTELGNDMGHRKKDPRDFDGLSVANRDVSETDPNGLGSGVPGAKMDNGKAPIMQGVLQYFPRALNCVASLSQKGADKYSWKGWEDVPDGINRYGNALGRHLVYEETEGLYDNGPGGTGELHATAVAWNALARLELILREQEANDGTNNDDVQGQ